MPEQTNRLSHRIQVDVHEDFPYIHLTVTTSSGQVQKISSYYDVAQTVFEPIVRNHLNRAVADIINQRKRRKEE